MTAGEPKVINIFRAASRLARPIKQATKAERVGIAVEGFGVRHVHLHLVPLYGEAELDPHRHIKQTRRELAEMAEKIRKEIPGAEAIETWGQTQMRGKHVLPELRSKE